MFPTADLCFLNHIVELWSKLINILLGICYSNGDSQSSFLIIICKSLNTNIINLVLLQSKS